ncbi:permease [mine drainage metagenome]|uniref:Permease n=2 Tax=mine drainage metagenome TaxID=410659 RepID=T0ZTQ2_9ZZZZ
MSITSPGVLFLVSIVAGFIGAMSGMGGGIVLIPALTLFGVNIKHAIAISIVSVIATSSGAASAYVRDGVTNLKVGMFLEMFTILGAIIGATVTLVSSDQPLFIAFGIVLLISWGTLFIRKHHLTNYLQPADRFSRWLELRGAYYDHAEHQEIEYQGRRAWLGGPCMFGAGFIAGLLGIGAGALKVLILDLAMGLPPKVSTTTSNLIIGVTALAGTSIYIAAGYVDPGLVAPVIVGVVAGAFIGTRLLKRLSNQAIRQFFLVVLLALGIEMIRPGGRVIA